jgi:hypothetical protein
MPALSMRFDSNDPWPNETAAQDLLGGSRGDLISLKVRPIDTDGWNRYVYADEYTEMRSILGPGLRRGRLGDGPADNAGVYQTEGGLYLVAEHETGPEIVVYLAAIGAALGLAEKLVGLIKVIMEIIAKHVENKRQQQESSSPKVNPSGERYYDADAISIEVRTRSGAKRLAVFELQRGVSVSESEILAALRTALPTAKRQPKRKR